MVRSGQIRKLRSKAAGIAVLLAGALLAASLCFGAPGDPSPVPSIFDPRSTPTKSIDHLSRFVLSITGLIFAVVFALLIYVVVKYRKRPGDDGREPAQVYGSTQIELAQSVWPFSARRPRVRGGTDVGCRDGYLSRPRSACHAQDPLARQIGFA
jgi:hypothetical protein